MLESPPPPPPHLPQTSKGHSIFPEDVSCSVFNESFSNENFKTLGGNGSLVFYGLKQPTNFTRTSRSHKLTQRSILQIR